MAIRIIYGTAEFFVGVNLDVAGIVSNTNESLNISCFNKMVLGKYGWEPTLTPIKTFSKCNIRGSNGT